MTGASIWRRGLMARLAVFGAAGALVFAACGQPAASPTPAAPAAASPTAKPAARGQGGTLKILYWQAPTILNPHQGTGVKDTDASSLILEPLANYDPDAKPVARLAAEVPTVQNGGIAKDLTSITWKLKQGVKWSDGTDFTADDVVFTYQYVKDPKTGASSSDNLETMKTVEAIDKYTVKLTFTEPNPAPYNCCTGAGLPILQKAQFKDFIGEKAGQAPANNKPIGTGPYKLKEFKPGDVVLYEINDQYRDKDKPFFKDVQIKGGGDATSAARAVLQTGDVDYSWNLQVEASVLRPLAQQSTKGELFQSKGNLLERLELNRSDPNKEVNGQRSEKSTKHPFLSDINVRKALALASDRETMAKEIYGDGLTGSATCTGLSAPPQFVSPNAKTFATCKFDLAAASKLLDDAGWVKGADGVRAKGGVQLKILYRTATNAVRQKVQDINKKNWESIGFKVELSNAQTSTYFSNKSPDSANYFYADINMYASTMDPDPVNWLGGWTTGQIAQKENNWNFSNYNRYSNPEYDKLVQTVRTETDPEKRKAAIIAANDILVNDVVIIPLIHRFNTHGKAKDLKGAGPNGWDTELWNIADWSK